jgi:peptidoglycan/xylan/chitin deacetylase (PgdA/CDA1 family)
MFLHYSPFWLKAIYPRYIWHIPVKEKKIFLTFDDGPIPEITEFVLDKLREFNAKATFFCIGDNVRKHQNIYQKLLSEGHSVGNHTFNHMNGWKTENPIYIENISLCDQQLGNATQLFRPPYGRIKRSQANLLPKECKIVMWDVLSGDFSPQVSPQVCLSKSIKYTKSGSIVLFHDSLKAAGNMMYALPKYLKHFTENGYRFEALPMSRRSLEG